MKKLSKRAKLYLMNILAAVFLLAGVYFGVLIQGVNPILSLLIYALLQSAVTFLSLIVYYLSIVADALSARIPKANNDNAN